MQRKEAENEELLLLFLDGRHAISREIASVL